MTGGTTGLGLYGSPNSPFSQRITLAADAKGVALDALPLPEGGLRSAAFVAINPVAKIPVLRTEDGMHIAESGVILEYLEDRFPTPSLLPRDAGERAFMRMVIAMTDRYFMAPVIRLFPQLDPARRDAAVGEVELARWRAGLASLEAMLARPLSPVEAAVSMADCVLAPSFHLGTRIAALLELPADPLDEYPGLTALYRRLIAMPPIASALARMTDRQTEKDAIAGVPSVAGRHVHLTR